MTSESAIEEVTRRVSEAIELLDDITFTVLREAARGSGVRPTADKSLLQARRALEKAARLLGSMSDLGDDIDDEVN